MQVFKRKIYSKFLEWKNESNGKTALLVQGARRIGKSIIVEEFAKNEYKSYILIDFSLAAKKVKDLFEDISDLDYFFRMLQFYFNVELFKRDSLIIFDEVQLFPLARQAIKKLVNDGRYDFMETGSLISIKKNVKNILIPSEERKIDMFPMDYEEFCWAIEKTSSFNLGREMFEKSISFGSDVNRTLMRNFRLYMIIGGMPQAIAEFLESNNFRKVDQVKRDILTLYDDDFRKIDQTGKISLIFKNVPAELNKNASRYQVSSVLKDDRASSVLEKIAELADSKTVNIAYHANDPNAGLSQNKDLEKFKMFLCDTGLFVTLCFNDKDFTENIIYEKLLSDKLEANLGYVYENVVAQMLRTSRNELYYHTFKSETSNHNYEIDFILSRKNKICPIEVKSSVYKNHKSLDFFTEKFSSKILNRYIFCQKEFHKENDIFCIPFYMAMFV